MKQILVAGLGQFGSSIALALESLGFDVIAIEKKKKGGSKHSLNTIL